MEKTKVLHIITRLDRGGSADVVLSAAAGLAKDRYQVKLITGLTRSPQADIGEYARKTGVAVISIPSLRRSMNPINNLLAFLELYLNIKRERPHIVHTHTTIAGILGRAAAKLAKVPIIVHSPHGHVFYGYFGNLRSKFFIFLEKIIASFTDRIITLTELGKKDHIRLGIAKPGKFIVVPGGIELERFLSTEIDTNEKKRELGVSPRDLVVGAVGRLDPIKGHEYFIQAAAQVKEEISNVRFILVGDGPLRDRLKNLSLQLGLGDDMIFTGERLDVPEIMSVFDLFVLSSINEGLGRVIVEAMACGLPVVATRVGGVPEVVKDGVTGTSVPPKDPSRMAEAVVRLLNDKNQSEKMGDAGRRLVNPKFGIEAMVKKIEQAYERLVIEKLKNQ